jgi:hypothetical protein
VLVLVALLLVFGWLLPRFIDYQEVWDALKKLDAPKSSPSSGSA